MLDAALEDGKKLGEKIGEEKGLQQGIQQGHQEGLEEGLEKGKLLVAKSLLSRGMAIEEVAEATGLSLELLTETFVHLPVQ